MQSLVTLPRLLCISFAAVGAVHSNFCVSGERREDPVDVITLGVMHRPLAGKTRSPGAINKIGSTETGLDELESPDMTLNRLLRRTLGLGPTFVSPVEQSRRQQQTSLDAATIKGIGGKEREGGISGKSYRENGQEHAEVQSMSPTRAGETIDVDNIAAAGGNHLLDARNAIATEGQIESIVCDNDDVATLDRDEGGTRPSSAHILRKGSDTAATDVLSSSSMSLHVGTNGIGDLAAVVSGTEASVLVSVAVNRCDVSEIHGADSLSVLSGDFDDGCKAPEADDVAEKDSPSSGGSDIGTSTLSAEGSVERDSWMLSGAEDDEKEQRNFRPTTINNYVDIEPPVAHGEAMALARPTFADAPMTDAEDMLPGCSDVDDDVIEQSNGRGLWATFNVPRASPEIGPFKGELNYVKESGDVPTKPRDFDRVSHIPEAESRRESNREPHRSQNDLTSSTFNYGQTSASDEKENLDARRSDSAEGHAMGVDENAVSVEIAKALGLSQAADSTKVPNDADEKRDAYSWDTVESSSCGDGHREGYPLEIQEDHDDIEPRQRTNDISSPGPQHFPPLTVLTHLEDDSRTSASTSADDSIPSTAASDVEDLPARSSDRLEYSEMKKTAGRREEHWNPGVFGPGIKSEAMGSGAGGSGSDGGTGDEICLPSERMPEIFDMALDDPAPCSFSPLTAADEASLMFEIGNEEDDVSDSDIDETQVGSMWRGGATLWAQEAQKRTSAHASQWGKVARERGIMWSGKASKFCKRQGTKLWRNYLQDPAKQARGSFNELGQFLLTKIGEYMADPVLAELL